MSSAQAGVCRECRSSWASGRLRRTARLPARQPRTAIHCSPSSSSDEQVMGSSSGGTLNPPQEALPLQRQEHQPCARRSFLSLVAATAVSGAVIGSSDAAVAATAGKAAPAAPPAPLPVPPLSGAVFSVCVCRHADLQSAAASGCKLRGRTFVFAALAFQVSGI